MPGCMTRKVLTFQYAGRTRSLSSILVKNFSIDVCVVCSGLKYLSSSLSSQESKVNTSASEQLNFIIDFFIFNCFRFLVSFRSLHSVIFHSCGLPPLNLHPHQVCPSAFQLPLP